MLVEHQEPDNGHYVTSHHESSSFNINTCDAQQFEFVLDVCQWHTIQFQHTTKNANNSKHCSTSR